MRRKLDYQVARHHKRLRSKRLAAGRQLGRHTVEQWKQLVEFCGRRCVCCGVDDYLVRDHILPLYLGGSDGIENIQPLCWECNSRKGPDSTDHRPEDWREALRTDAEKAAHLARWNHFRNIELPGVIKRV